MTLAPSRLARRMEVLGSAFVGLLTLSGALPAQRVSHDDHTVAHDSAATGPSRFGTVVFRNSGPPAVQPTFLRGLALLHNFQYNEAVAAFREAERLDPGFAMAYWGEAMSYNHGVWREQDSAAARAALDRLGPTPAARAARAPTRREQDYLSAVEALYGTSMTKPARDTAYSRAMGELAARYPDDVDAQLFHALALLSLFPRTDTTYLRAARIAEAVMRGHPDHPGALHYVIHAYDDPAHARLGLAAARGYSHVAPDAPHAQHMTSHIFIALGMWDDVVAANEVALHTNERARGADAVAAAMCGHAGIWLHYAYIQQGRFADARRMMDGCRAGSASSLDMARGYVQMRLRDVIDAAALPAAADAPAALDAAVRLPPHARYLEDFATAFAALRSGDTIAAAPVLERMRAVHTSLAAAPAGAAPDDWRGPMEVTDAELQAMLLLRRGRDSDAVALLRRAAATEDALPFAFGPPEVQKPAHELLGEVLLATGRPPEEARRELELALARTPGRSLTLIDLARAARAAGDTAAATAAERQLGANWHRADARGRPRAASTSDGASSKTAALPPPDDHGAVPALQAISAPCGPAGPRHPGEQRAR